MFAIIFRLATNSVNDLMYNIGLMNVVEAVTDRRTLLVCSQASVFIFLSVQYKELRKEEEHDLWFCSWKESVVMLISINLLGSRFKPNSFTLQLASYIRWGL